MAADNGEYQAPSAAPRGKGKGCLFRCCLVAGLCACALLVVGVLLTKQLLAFASDYTSKTPASVPSSPYSVRQVAALDARLERFLTAIDRNKPATLILTSKNLNAKLATMRGFRETGGQAHVTIQGAVVSLLVSLPLDPIGMKGRYFNATMKLRILFENGKLTVYPYDLTSMGGKVPPPRLAERFAEIDLAEQIRENKEFQAALAKIGGIEVRGGNLVITR